MATPAPPDQAAIDAAQQAEIDLLRAQLETALAQQEEIKLEVGLAVPPPPPPEECPTCNPQTVCATCGNSIGPDGLPVNPPNLLPQKEG